MQYCTDVMSRQAQYRLSFQFQIALRNSECEKHCFWGTNWRFGRAARNTSRYIQLDFV